MKFFENLIEFYRGIYSSKCEFVNDESETPETSDNTECEPESNVHQS